MHAGLAANAAQQNGLFTRAQAVEAGYRERQLRTLLKPGGEWVTVRRGVYIERSRWEDLDPYEGELVARDWAAHLMMREVHVLSHDSAARAHGLPMLAEHRELVHVTRPWVTGARTECGVKHHLAKHEPFEIETVAGLPVTGLARTALDLAREHGELAGLIACDAALRRGVTMEVFDTCLTQMRCWPGITAGQRAVDRADPGAETIAESLGRDLVQEAGLGPVVTQFPVNLGWKTVWIDMGVGRHLIEVDGWVKFVPQSAGGVADQAPDEVFRDQMDRQTDVTGLGFGMSRLMFRDFFGRRRQEAIQRVRREYAVTLQRFGTQLTPEMVEFAERMESARQERIFGAARRHIA